MQDAFRARVMFPIFTENGEAAAFGGRILPGSTDPAKYKNSSETPIYAKSRTLYGLHWAKADIVTSDQVIVCEGYTDVIGFHRAGIKRAVATCGTALTEEHVRLMKRYASNVVLAFDADSAGQGAAAKFYEWEQKYQLRVFVARFPKGSDPGELSQTNPDALRDAVDKALPFLKFRLDRVLAARPLRSNEDRVGAAREAMAVVNEHPDLDIRKLYAIEVAGHVGLPEADVVKAAVTRSNRPEIRVTPQRRLGSAENAEFVGVALLLQRWNEIADWLIEELFADESIRRAFLALAETDGGIDAALAAADPEAREVLERAAVADVDAVPFIEACNLIGAAVRRELRRPVDLTDTAAVHAHRDAKLDLEQLDDVEAAPEAASRLLGWLAGRSEERV
jgi:DNA primase